MSDEPWKFFGNTGFYDKSLQMSHILMEHFFLDNHNIDIP